MLLIRRAAAYFTDILLLFAVLAPVGYLARMAAGWPGAAPTGFEVWVASAVNFSVPAWAYFALSDRSPRGATIGKRLLRVRVSRHGIGQVGGLRALARTAVKLLPWETAHVSAFALSAGADGLAPAQVVGLTAANGLAVAYFVAVCLTRGRRSVHDYVVATEVVNATGS
jgi:uncharacterized RDD family membrane protein YckC